MKNIHILPTDQPTGIFETNSGLQFSIMNKVRHGEFKGYHIYITSDEEIRKNDYYIHNNRIGQSAAGEQEKGDYKNCKKIILTTDPTLIADGVQAIDDEFLEWFVKNPSCEEVKIEDYGTLYNFRYLIIIPQEEPKQEFLLFDKERANTITSEGQKTVRELQNTIQQETLEEAAENHQKGGYEWQNEKRKSFIAGAKWQAERMYSEEDLRRAYTVGKHGGVNQTYYDFDEWLEQNKKK